MSTSILSTLSIQKIIIGIENLKFSPLVDHKYFALPETITSVGWSLRGPLLGVGTNNGEV